MSPRLSPKRDVFCQEYLVDLDGTKAVYRAGYKPKNAAIAARMALELLRDPSVSARIGELMKARAQKLGMDAEAVLARYAEIANADVRNLMQTYRGACRHCHGIDHDFQWRTPREFTKARATWEADIAAEMERDHPRPAVMAKLRAAEPVDDGGIGYRRTLSPHPDCPECDGLGVTFVVLADTRTLDPVTARLFAGAKETDKGIEIKTQDQMHALDQVARHLGLFAKDNPVTETLDALGELVRHIQQSGSKAPIVAVPPEVVP